MTDETESGRVSRTRVVRASAVQQYVKHPPLSAGLITGPTAEEGVGPVGGRKPLFLHYFLTKYVFLKHFGGC